MKNPFEKFHNLHQIGEYDKALVELKSIEKQHPLPPNVLVLKGSCIQLASEELSYKLTDAEAAFKEALEIDKKHTDALLDLGYLYLRVYD